MYVGTSARTSTSVHQQFLHVARQYHYLPCHLRSDYGGEISGMGDAFWALRQSKEPDVTHEYCYWFGESTANQRIESWWGQLTKSVNFVYRVSWFIHLFI
ncbi:MAG: hypothetical protein ACRD8Z_07545 [Nitrososphaeraceae archaeon]